MYKLDSLRLLQKKAESQLASREGQRDLLFKQKEKAELRLQKAQNELSIYDKVQILLQMTSDFARQQAKQRIEEIVTSALSVVFGKDYKFTIAVEVKANQPVAAYYLKSEGVVTQLRPPDYDRGGGVADVVSLALKLAVGELTGIRGPLLLDEVGKHVSMEYAPNVAFFLREYSENFNRQICLITHNEHLSEIGEKAIHITQKNGKSQVVVE